MNKRNAIAIAISSLFAVSGVNAATIYSNDDGDFLKLYGEVGVGGHFGADYDSGEFYADENYIDDSFGTIGVKGQDGDLQYRLELDYERENWKYGSGDMVMSIDKMFVGYAMNQYNYIEVGLTDTAFDDYDKWGDFTFDTTVETGEAGDQSKTLKYEGNYAGFKVGASYTYKAESSSGSELGNVANGYFGYFGDDFSAVLGAEARSGSDGDSKYGEQKLLGVGARYAINKSLVVGFNGFMEHEDIARDQVTINNTDPENVVKVYSNYTTQKNKGALVSGKYILSDKWQFVISANYEEYEKWDDESADWDGTNYEWGASRTWRTIGVNFKPTKSSVIALEMNQGEASQDAYAYTRIYF